MKKMLILLFPLFLTGCWEVKNGEKIGQIVDIHKSGLFFDTWECVIIRGGLDDGTGTLGSKLELTIENPETLLKAQKYMKDRKNIKAKYHKEALILFRSDSMGYFLDDVEVSNEN